MKQQTMEAKSGRQWRFIVVAALVGGLTFVSGLRLGAWNAATPVIGEAEAILAAQPVTDAATNRGAFGFSYAASSVTGATAQHPRTKRSDKPGATHPDWLGAEPQRLQELMPE
jgi:hypothetical protein